MQAYDIILAKIKAAYYLISHNSANLTMNLNNFYLKSNLNGSLFVKLREFVN